MTAPRRAARRSPPVGRPHPSSITIALIALALALALPVGALTTARQFDSDATALAATSAMISGAVLVFLAATKRRAGRSIGWGGLVLPTLVSAGVIVAVYIGATLIWAEWREPAADLVLRDAALPLGLMAASTFIVVYATLSMARR